MLKPALRYSHQLLEDVIANGDIVVDATMGNGHDTLFLAQLVGENGLVYGFDVQEKALFNTTKLLKEHHALKQTQLFLKGHENIHTVFDTKKEIKAAIFNLGYLPRGDKSIVTSGSTTIKSLSFLMDHLEKKGRIILVLYDGHEEGKIEKQQILEFVSMLNQQNYSVLSYQFMNQKNNPPSLICIEKKNK